LILTAEVANPVDAGGNLLEKDMKNLSIRIKLILAVSALTVSVLVIAGVGLFQLTGLRDSMRDIALSRMPRAILIQQINTVTSDYRVAESLHILADTPEKLVVAEKRLTGIENKLSDLATKYKAIADTEAAKKAFTDILQRWSIYMESHKKLLALSSAQRNEEATALFIGAHSVAFEDVSGAMDALADRIGKAAETAAKDADDEVADAVIISLSLAGFAGAIALFVILFSLRGVSRPLTSMAGAMQSLAQHDYTVTIPGVGRGDEIGQMAGALDIFRSGLLDADRLAAEQKQDQEQKALRQQKIEGFITRFEQTTSQALGTMSGAATELQATAQLMSDTASATNQQSATVAAASEEATVNVQTVASASEELTSSITEISRQVQESAQIAARATGDAERTVGQVRQLNNAAQRIGDVIKLISDVASQTNLLALNATIEAARAGEAGKGFAVVASEVKNLASQTAKATEEIAAQVASVQNETGTVVDAIEDIGRTIQRMNQIASGVAAAVEEQGAATHEIARNVQQAAVGTQQVSSSILDVTQGANQTGAAATQVLGAANELAQQGEQLKREVETFLHNIQAA
jgi:methyl-accepting chemotaxis protein